MFVLICFDFFGFLSVAYTTLNKLLAVFFINQSIPHRPFLIGCLIGYQGLGGISSQVWMSSEMPSCTLMFRTLCTSYNTFKLQAPV